MPDIETQSKPAPLIEARGVTKSFDGNVVLQDVDLTLYSGEIEAVVGENGAGKSTLMKILGGVYAPDKGELFIGGSQVQLRTPKDAIDKGVVVIHQEFSLTPHLSAEENIFLGHYPVTRFGTVNRRLIREQTVQLLERLSVRIDPALPVSQLSIAQQQMVEIAKALSIDTKVLILDEPTAVLDEGNVRVLFDVLSRLRQQGLGIIYISHHLEEIFDIADRVTVLRDGKRTGNAPVKEVDKQWLISRMIGRDFPVHKTNARNFGQLALEVEGLASRGQFEDISLTVHQGEIVGLAGLVGAGRTEIAQAVFGLSKPHAGIVKVFGKKVSIRSPSDAAKLGIAYVTEDRKRNGLFPGRPTYENITMSNLRRFYKFPALQLAKERKFAEHMVSSLDIRLASVSTRIQNLSGGNQQKVVIARSLAVEPRILLLDEPTRGVDIGAKQEIYAFIETLIQQGIAIILISSEMEEILRLADRIVILRQGRVIETVNRDEATEDRIMNAAALATPPHERDSYGANR